MTASFEDPRELASRQRLDATIKNEGGGYAFDRIEKFATRQSTTRAAARNNGLLEIHSFRRPEGCMTPLQLQVCIGHSIVQLGLLIWCPIGRVALEDRFASAAGCLQQTDIQKQARKWGSVPPSESISRNKISKDRSIIFWGIDGHLEGYEAVNLGRTKAGRALLETVRSRQCNVRPSRSMPALGSQHVSTSLPSAEHLLTLPYSRNRSSASKKKHPTSVQERHGFAC